MSVAIVIPNLNYGKWLGRAIYSAQAQTVPPEEIIVVDGNSTDASRLISKEAGVTLLTSPAKGIADARNVGIQATQCKYIVPLDADDWISPLFVEHCLQAFTETTGIAATGLTWPDGRVQWPAEPITRETLLTGNRLFSCSMFRRDCWEAVGGYDPEPRIYEDWLLWGQIVSRGWGVAVVREPLFHYCPHPGSSCDRMSRADDIEYRTRTIVKLKKSGEKAA